LILVELLTITQWVEVRGDFCWYWWNCWPSLNELKWEVIFVDIGGIVDHHIEWWSTIPPISTNITSHFNSLSDGQQFHQYQQEMIFVDIGEIVDHHSINLGERWFLLILVECWPSLNELNRSTIPPIAIKITPHLNSLSDGQKFHQYQQKSPLTSTHWVMVNNSTNINKHHLSLQLIEWWSKIQPPSLNELNRGVIFVDIGGGIVDPHSMSWSERWCLLILVELLQFHQYQQKSPLSSTHWVMVTNSTNISKNHCWYWWNCWPSLNELRWEMIFVDIGGIFDHHSMS
jgi:hypothetical protein